MVKLGRVLGTVIFIAVVIVVGTAVLQGKLPITSHDGPGNNRQFVTFIVRWHIATPDRIVYTVNDAPAVVSPDEYDSLHGEW